MTKWASDTRQRRSARYKALHADLKRDIALAKYLPKPVRHKIEAQEYRQQGQA